MTYKASLDNLAIGITIGITILFAVLIIGEFSFLKDHRQVIPFMSVFSLLIYFGVFAFRPLSYSITDRELIIHRPIMNVKIDRKHIKSVEVADKSKLSYSLRTFGVSGLFGYYGKFANFSLGTMTWYATRRDRFVLIRTDQGKKIVLTPDEPALFVNNFN